MHRYSKLGFGLSLFSQLNLNEQSAVGSSAIKNKQKKLLRQRRFKCWQPWQEIATLINTQKFCIVWVIQYFYKPSKRREELEKNPHKNGATKTGEKIENRA